MIQISSSHEIAKIYKKLFNALEEGTRKEERSLVKELRRDYKIPRYKKVSNYLAGHVDHSEVFVKITNYLFPFSQMLNDIYQFLDEHKSSLFGNTDQFAFNFEKLSQRVPFGLDSFPKTYLNIASSRLVEGILFNADASGRLLSDNPWDNPNCWSATNALENLGHHPVAYLLIYVLQGYGYDEVEHYISKHKKIIEKVIDNARVVIKLCSNLLIYDQEGFELVRRTGHFYYRTSEDLYGKKQLVKERNATYSLIKTNQN